MDGKKGKRVKKEELRFARAGEGAPLHASFWLPEGVQPTALLQISHGMCEYIDRYDSLARALTAHGFVVFGNDHRGHGLSAANEDDLGYFSEKEDINGLVSDLRRMNDIARERFPDLPCFLLGHSMGSFLARIYITRFTDLAGVVLSGTGHRPEAGLAHAVARAFVRRKGPRYRSQFLYDLAFKTYNHRFADDKEPFAWLSRDLAIGKAFGNDAHSNYLFTTAGMRDLFAMLARVSRRYWAQQVPVALPILLIAGADDPVGHYGKAVRAVERQLRRSGVADLTCTIYPECRHELHFERNKDEVIRDLIAWLEARATQKRP